MKLTFNFDVNEYDIVDYEKNPVVTFCFDQTQLIGRITKIDKKKNTVEVEFYDDAFGNLIASNKDLYGIAPGYLPPDNKLLEFSIVTNIGDKHGTQNHKQK